MGLSGLWARSVFFGSLGLVAACGSCEVGSSGPVPGGFDEAARIPRAAQVRLTSRGLAPIAEVLNHELGKASHLDCASDADCPSFADGSGGSITASCDLVRGYCRENVSAEHSPAVGLALPSDPNGICRGTEPCRLAARVEGVELSPIVSSGARLAIDLRLADAQISVRNAGLGADCRLSVVGAAGLTRVAIDLTVGPRTAPGTSPQLVLDAASALVALPAGSLSLSPDPIFGDAGDVALCVPANLPAIRSGLQAELASIALPIAQSLVGQALGKVCDVDADCGAGAVCSADDFCQAANGTTIVPEAIDFSERLILPALLGSVGYAGRSGAPADASILLGGTFDADATGLGFGLLGGFEPVELDPACATLQATPRLRPSYVAPAALPSGELADLDFDGTPETPYGIGLGVSKAMLDQVIYSIYSSGLLCGSIGTEETGGDIHTGTLELLIPSIRFLTKSHLYPRSERPVHISVSLLEEPVVSLDSGKFTRSSSGDTYDAPLLKVDLNRFQLNLSTIVEERWTRIMTLTLDLHLGIGAMITPANELVPIVGVGVSEIISNVEVTNSELLNEPPESLEMAIPTLISFALLDLAGEQDAIPLPSINGVDYQVLGVRGLENGGRYDQLAVYADMSLSGLLNLEVGAETHATIANVVVPKTEAFAVTHVGGPELPRIELAVDASQGGNALEHQYTLDGGTWSPFTRGDRLIIQRPELLRQGKHRLQVRARIVGQYRSLDPTPTALEVWIDSEAPVLNVTRTGDTLAIDAWDRLGEVRLELVAGDTVRTLSLDASGATDLLRGEPEAQPLIVRAIDQAGLVTEVTLRAAAPATVPGQGDVTATGCRAVGAPRTSLGYALALIAWIALRRRR